MICLPQNDPNQNERTEALEKQRSKYEYDYEKLPGVPMLKKVPPEDESFNNVDWVSSAISLLLRVRANTGLQDSEKRGKFCRLVLYFFLSLVIANPKNKKSLEKFLRFISSTLQWVQQLVNRFRLKFEAERLDSSKGNPVTRNVNRMRIKILLPKLEESIKHPRTAIREQESQRHNVVEALPGINDTKLSFSEYQNFLKPYRDLFQIIYLPEIHKYFQLDKVFAAQRVAGSNPLVIERVVTLPENFPLSEKQYQAVMGENDSLARAGREGRLYLADYAVLSDIKTSSFPSAQKYLCAPLALFAVPEGTGTQRSLVPVGIQCQQKPGSENPIFTPPPLGTPQPSQWGWLIAKTIVQIADGNYHELISHLGRTHLLLEIFAIATPRQLARNHPLFVLLHPHFEGTVFINEAALKGLINPEGTVEAVLAGTLSESLSLSAKAVQGFPFSFNDSMLPKTFAKRKVEDLDKLPDYPYRDDSLLIWEAIHQWVSDYLSLYYKVDEDIKDDTELQKWLDELIDPKGGQMKMNAIGEPHYVFRTKSYLIEVVTLIIFTASAQHAAVNFPQRDFMTYGPTMPLAGYRPAPIQLAATDKDFFELLPSLPQTETQMNMTYVLGSVYFTRLGQYEPGYFTDQNVQPLLAKFQKRLEEIGLIIDDRNTYRPTYYDYLHPTKIPQSINI